MVSFVSDEDDGSLELNKVKQCLPAQTDITDDAILQPFRTIDFLFKNGTRLAVKKTWKSPIQNGIYKTIGLISGGLLLQLIGIALHGVTKQKVFTIAVNIGAVGLGITGGYFCLKAINDYENGISGAIAKRSRPYYFPEKENMGIGYNLAKYSAIMTIVASTLIIVYIGLYIPFGEEKWIWQKKTNVLPDKEQRAPPKTNTESIPKTIGQRKEVKKTEGKMNKVKMKMMGHWSLIKVKQCLPAQTDMTDDAILQPFRTIGFLFKNGTRLAVKSMQNDIAPNTRDEIIRSLGNSLHESVKLYSVN
ncbi:unnamed protein product [Mytilus coruscus]|uniref:Uncharacterized protein n=1 Tax=Mytilus coruscus TaxID=42192 RepID=A0A6J8BVE4_MYTCO|nr:unnamed protein product [Mytilus coruscus]